MRLITRRDTSLAVALIAGTLITFERPFRQALDLVYDVEQRYHIDLLPALTLLIVVFVFHQYKKRLQAKAELAAVSRDIARTRARTEELEKLMALGRALANALDRCTLEQQLWRALPSFVGTRQCSIVTRHAGGWDFLIGDAQMMHRFSSESLEGLVAQVPPGAIAEAAREGRIADSEIVFPMVAGEQVMGGLIIHNEPALSLEERLALGAAGALIAVACRNVFLLHNAARDGLTGCFTRTYALESLRKELRRTRRSGRPVSVIMFDLDGFKEINDRDGHLQGDALLASLGVQLHHLLRSTDIRCRYGGDEFLVILPDTPILGAQQVADELRREIAGTPRDAHGRVFVTASLGVACSMPGEHDALALIARADEALYAAKRGGRNRYCVAAAPLEVSVAS